jgi:ABC-2 type transport system permease protein
LYPLIQNETIKMIKKRRFMVIFLILLVLIPIFTYAQYRVSAEREKQFGTSNWRVEAEQSLKDMTNRLSSPRVPEEWKRYMKVEMTRIQYALERDVNPTTPNGVTFTREFMKNALSLFVPLLIAVVGADLVSSEQSSGTIKLLLTRPVPRWKILTSKLIALVMFVSLITVMIGVICYFVSGSVFGFHGWDEPVLVGYRIVGEELSTADVYSVSQWRFILMEYGLAWYPLVVVACITIMVSVLVRSTAAGMGIMLATLIAGTILAEMASSWTSAKYLFMLNLGTIDFLSGALPSIPGLTLTFSLTVLTVWAAGALVTAYAVFTKRDILN